MVSDANVFREMIDKLKLLVDLLLSGGQWTWTNMRNQPACSRIDRFLVPHVFLLQLPGVYQRILQQPISDHYPICLQAEGIQ